MTKLMMRYPVNMAFALAPAVGVVLILAGLLLR